MKLSKESVTVFFLIIVIAYFPLFLHLGYLSIHMWDEGRVAINAVEMAISGNFIVPTFEGAPDMWFTKPPFVIWLQALSIKLFGINELAVRLPIAISALFTVIFCFFMASRIHENLVPGIIVSLVILTSPGYINDHLARTGDVDVVLAFLMITYAFSFYLFFQSGKNKYLWITGIALSLAVLTKSVQGLLFLPALFLFSLYKGRIILLLKNKTFYYQIVVFCMLVGGYYLLREYLNPGYLAAVSENELGGRYFSTIEGHRHQFWYYYNNWINGRFQPWVYLLLPGIISAFIASNQKIREFNFYLLILILTYWLVISLSETKLPWYDGPLFPLSGLLIASGIHNLLALLFRNYFPEKYRLIITTMLIIAIFAVPYKNIIGKVYLPDKGGWTVVHFGYFFRDMQKHMPEEKVFTVYKLEIYNAHLLFYQYKYEMEKNYSLRIKAQPDQLETGEKVMFCEPLLLDSLEKRYYFDVIYQKHSCKYIQISGIKEGDQESLSISNSTSSAVLSNLKAKISSVMYRKNVPLLSPAKSGMKARQNRVGNAQPELLQVKITGSKNGRGNSQQNC